MCTTTKLGYGSSGRQTGAQNRRARCKGCFFALLGFMVPLALLALLVLGSLSRELLEVALGSKGTEALSVYLVSVFVDGCST